MVRTQKPPVWQPTSERNITGTEDWGDQAPHQAPPFLGTCTGKTSPHKVFENQQDLTPGEPEGYWESRLCS